MQTQEADTVIELNFSPQTPTGTKGVLVARQGDQLLHSDLVDIVRSDHAKRFTKQLTDRCPAVDSETVRQEILDIVDRQLKKTDNDASGQLAELDLSCAVPDAVPGMAFVYLHVTVGNLLAAKERCRQGMATIRAEHSPSQNQQRPQVHSQ